jgi:hypothetical protein
MIKGIFIINNNGKPRLLNCYEHLVSEKDITPPTMCVVRLRC